MHVQRKLPIQPPGVLFLWAIYIRGNTNFICVPNKFQFWKNRKFKNHSGNEESSGRREWIVNLNEGYQRDTFRKIVLEVQGTVVGGSGSMFKVQNLHEPKRTLQVVWANRP